MPGYGERPNELDRRKLIRDLANAVQRLETQITNMTEILDKIDSIMCDSCKQTLADGEANNGRSTR
jgi:hypothetical protein